MSELTLDVPIPNPMISEPNAAISGELPGDNVSNNTAPIGMNALPPIRMGRNPKRCSDFAAKVAPAGQPTIIMVRARPAITGERCNTPCTYMGRNVVDPIRIMPDRTVEPLHAAIGRRLQSANEIIGSA